MSERDLELVLKRMKKMQKGLYIDEKSSEESEL
jgi:hypothetical protein